MKKISIIIPAYNEEKTIENVVRIACQCKMAQEVIVISDGSTDNTEQRAKNAGHTFINFLKTEERDKRCCMDFKKPMQTLLYFWMQI